MKSSSRSFFFLLVSYRVLCGRGRAQDKQRGCLRILKAPGPFHRHSREMPGSHAAQRIGGKDLKRPSCFLKQDKEKSSKPLIMKTHKSEEENTAKCAQCSKPAGAQEPARCRQGSRSWALTRRDLLGDPGSSPHAVRHCSVSAKQDHESTSSQVSQGPGAGQTGGLCKVQSKCSVTTHTKLVATPTHLYEEVPCGLLCVEELPEGGALRVHHTARA